MKAEYFSEMNKMVDYFTIITRLVKKLSPFRIPFRFRGRFGKKKKKKVSIKEPIAESLGLCFRKSMTNTILLPMTLTDL